MSKPRRGKLVQAIFDAFVAEPDNAFTTADLCMRAYGVALTAITRAQRVAMQRAMKSAAESDKRLKVWNGEGKEGQLVVLDHTSIGSYGMARLKCDSFSSYQYIGLSKRCRWRILDGQEEKLRLELAGDRYNEYIRPGGAWYNHVEHFKAKLSGDTETANRLQREQDAAMARHVNTMKAMLAGDSEEVVTRDLVRVLARLERIDRSADRYTWWTTEEQTEGWQVVRVVSPIHAARDNNAEHEEEAA